ncbi:acyltransferase family protein [Granulicella sibirica]|uniref:acyltransferase family protein n=1 Tax=Granulicella sibirica TaxID=2479048 RepID=UPI0013760869|nr:acyltransferase [Granulicella sibirica]
MSGPRREIELDFLRGIAILAVLDFHSQYPILSYPFTKLGFTPLGWVGVDVFFVLSGFLVGGLLVKELKVRGRVDSRRFLIRRGFKIWPQYYLFLSLVVLTGHRSMSVMWPSFLNIQNYYEGVPHLWSLAIEEHAYLLLVLLLAIAWRVKMRMRSMFVSLGLMCFAIVVIRCLMLATARPFFTQTHTRVEGILYGVMIAIVYHWRPKTFERIQEWRAIWIGMLVLAIGFFRLQLHQVWSLSVAIDVANLIGVCLLMLIYRHREGVARSLPYRLVAWIGLYSYGIYLWHVAPSSLVIRIASGLPERAGTIFIAMAQPLLGIALGVLMTKLVEFPMLRLRDRWFPRRVESAVEDTPVEAAALAR